MNAKHVLRSWDRATDDERCAGRRWYPDAQGIARAIASFHGRDVETAAGVIAALSPQTAWSANIDAARAAFDGRWSHNALRAQYRANREKARRIIDGDHPRDVLGGWKVKAFYALVRDGGNPWDVCVDGHAVNVVLGVVRPGGDAPRLEGHALYTEYARAYRGAAERLGVKPHVVQATTWLVQRRRLDAVDSRHAYQRRAVS